MPIGKLVYLISDVHARAHKEKKTSGFNQLLIIRSVPHMSKLEQENHVYDAAQKSIADSWTI